jgi:hypothetical protein
MLTNSNSGKEKLNCPFLKTEGCSGVVLFQSAHSTLSTGPLTYSRQALSLSDCPVASLLLSYRCNIHISVSISPEPTISWYRDDEQVEEIERYRVSREALGNCHLDVTSLEIIDQVITGRRYTNKPWVQAIG